MYKKYKKTAAATAMDVPHMDQVVEEDNLRAGVAEVLKILHPDWDAAKVEIKDMSLGYANKNYSVMNGTEGIFLRLVTPMAGVLEVAIVSMRYLKRRKIGAQLLLTFNNGLVMELLDGKPISWETFHLIKEPDTWRGLAREIARYHGTTNMDDMKELGILNIDQFMDVFKEELKAIDPTLKSLDLPSTGEIFEKRDAAYKSLIDDGAEYALCHLDLNPTNVLLTDEGPILVDYDMCVYDLCAVNLATMFCSVTDIAKWNLDDYPTEEEKDSFIREYLEARSEIQPGFGSVDVNMVNHWKFMIEKAHLCFYIGAISTIVLMQGVATKPVDIGLATMFWEQYKKNQKILYMRYNKA